MASNRVIAVDLGGTYLRVGSVREDGVVEDRERLSSEARSGSEAVLGRVVGAVRAMAEKIASRQGSIAGVALGFPGIVDPDLGIVHQSPHFPDWKDLPILSSVRKQIPWPVVLDNDANFAALGEGWKGAGRGLKNFLMLTLGTGIGGGIVLEGKVWRGDRGFAGEFGHLCIEIDGPECACGSRGCLETYVSATGLLRLVEATDHPEGREALLERLGKPLARLTVEDLYQAAMDGDIFSNVLFKKAGYYLGIGVASLANAFGIENFIIGGGVSQAWDFFIEPTKKEIAERTYSETAKRLRLHRAQLDDDAGLIGGSSSFFLK